ncbi:sorting nexin-16-like isoform X1 [Labrus mixtus]|uniref:sorting nexin-16-like isoform X1 n=1 Tax=Labrus mixtus TaxID=508554 RepID=UPI0029C0AE9D|nr:sorting nexin-16-like isoform X1 [Labrus mixtus]
MAAPFVPVPLHVDLTGACRSWAKKESEPPPPERISSMRAVRPWAQTSAYFCRRPRGDMLDGPSTLLGGEGRVWDNWVERPITPTLLGYEILEERAKFTVYKIHVTTAEGDSWVIFRRYTDFCRLNDKLKELYPSSTLALPPKRWFKDNYDEEFLEERLSGLQSFLQSLTAHKEVIRRCVSIWGYKDGLLQILLSILFDFEFFVCLLLSEEVRRFLCLVDPPGPFDSLVESRAFCETLEETNHHLQRELLDNQREVDALKKILEEKETHISLLVKKAKSLTLPSESSEDRFQQTEKITTDTNTLEDGDTDLNGSEKVHTNGSEAAGDDRGMSINEDDKESNHETNSYIYPLCYW